MTREPVSDSLGLPLAKVPRTGSGVTMILHAGEQHMEWASWWRDAVMCHRVRIEVCRSASGVWIHEFRITCCGETINLRVEHAEAYRRALEMMRDHILGSSPGISLLEWASQG